MTFLTDYQPSLDELYQLHANETDRTYEIRRNGTLMERETRPYFDLPQAMSLPWANEESFLFSICNEIKSVAHFYDAIRRIQDKECLFLNLMIPAALMRTICEDLGLTKPIQLKALFERLESPDYCHALSLNQKVDISTPRSYRLILASKGTLETAISPEMWRHLKAVAEEVCPSVRWPLDETWTKLLTFTIPSLTAFLSAPDVLNRPQSSFEPIEFLDSPILDQLGSETYVLLHRLLSGVPMTAALRATV